MSEAPGATSCQSCSMTIESGDYCEYCTDDNGGLLSFNETFERFIQFAMGRDADLDRTTAEANTRKFMSTMPAWREHPEVASN